MSPTKAICHEICRRPGRTKPGNVSQSCRGVQMVKKSNLVSKLVAPIFCSGGGGFVLRLGAPHGRASPSPPPAWSSAGAASRDGGINPAPPLASPTPPVTGALTDLRPAAQPARSAERRERWARRGGSGRAPALAGSLAPQSRAAQRRWRRERRVRLAGQGGLEVASETVGLGGAVSWASRLA
jgi:hypothetical protein